MRVTARIAFASVVLASVGALAQTQQPGPSIMYKNLEYRFGVIFPNQVQPMARDTTYTTKDGATVPARQFYLETPGPTVHRDDGPAAERTRASTRPMWTTPPSRS